jgi:hypothetical protein
MVRFFGGVVICFGSNSRAEITPLFGYLIFEKGKLKSAQYYKKYVSFLPNIRWQKQKSVRGWNSINQNYALDFFCHRLHRFAQIFFTDLKLNL